MRRGVRFPKVGVGRKWLKRIGFYSPRRRRQVNMVRINRFGSGIKHRWEQEWSCLMIG